MQEAYEREDDLFDLCNVFVVQCENPELREMMQAVSINDDPASGCFDYAAGESYGATGAPG